MSTLMALPSPIVPAKCARGDRGRRGPDSTLRTPNRFPAPASRPRRWTASQQAAGKPCSQPLAESVQVAGEQRRDHGVDRGRAHSLVQPHLRQHLAGERDVRRRQRRRELLGRPLASWLESQERIQEADGDALDAAAAQGRNGLVQRFPVEGHHLRGPRSRAARGSRRSARGARATAAGRGGNPSGAPACRGACRARRGSLGWSATPPVAPRRVSSALVATVLPWMMRSVWERSSASETPWSVAACSSPASTAPARSADRTATWTGAGHRAGHSR